jgi:hypothetical protein
MLLFTILAPVAVILIVIAFIFWQALILYFVSKLFKVADASYKKALQISLRISIAAIPVGLAVQFLQNVPAFPFSEVISNIIGGLLIFLVANYYYKRYYQTELVNNIGIFLGSNIVNVIVGILLALLIFGPLWFSILSQPLANQRSKQPVADTSKEANVSWQTYTDPQYNFEFKYPGDWVMTKGNASNSEPYLFLKSPDDNSQGQSYPYTFWISATEGDIQTLDGFQQFYAGVGENYSPTTVAGQPGLVFNTQGYKGNGGLLITQYYFLYKGNGYDIVYRNSFKDISERIISTFKFTN